MEPIWLVYRIVSLFFTRVDRSGRHSVPYSPLSLFSFTRFYFVRFDASSRSQLNAKVLLGPRCPKASPLKVL